MSSEQQPQQSIATAFRATARSLGQATAVVGLDSEWTFAELDRVSDAIAAGLASRGTAPGDRFGLYCINVPEFSAVYLGILKAGATVVPINVMLSPREISYILEDAGVKGLFYHGSLVDGAAAARALTSNLAFAVGIDLQGGTDPSVGDFASGGAAAPPSIGIDPKQQLAAILYTSGTTGRPKGAMLTHANLLANTASVMQALDLRAGSDRMLVVLPLFHAFAATVGMLTPLLHGLSLVVVERFEPKLVSAAIARFEATVFLGVPSMYSLLLRLDDADVRQWRSVRFCVSGGAAMPRAVMADFERRFEIPVLEGDGPTECSPVTCVNPLHGARKASSVGLPIPGVEMRIAGADGRTLADGERGEVCVRGPNVMMGYWGLRAETESSFFDDWFRTGDWGYRDQDGYFFLVDRIKDLIIVNGMNVYPRMIEEVLYRHPDVTEAAVVGEPSDLHGEIVVAHVVLRDGATTATTDLRAWCRESLGRHEVPRRIRVRESLPRNAAGKVLKRELRRAGELERGVNIPMPGQEAD